MRLAAYPIMATLLAIRAFAWDPGPRLLSELPCQEGTTGSHRLLAGNPGARAVHQ